MKPLLVGLLLSSTSFAQLHLTMSQQGSESLRTVAGKKVKGVGLLAVVIQNRGPVDRIVDPGVVYGAIGHAGVSFIAPAVADVTISRNAALSLPSLLLDVTSLASSGTGIAGVLGGIKMSNGLAAVLTAGAPLAIQLLKSKLNAAQPQPATAPLLNIPVGVKQGSSVIVFVAYRYSKDFLPLEADLP